MAEWKKNALTNAGIALIARAVAGETNIIFTRVETGDGEFQDTEDLSKVTALKNPKQSFFFSACEVLNENTAHLKYIISNVNPDSSKLTEGYYIRETAIYARAADQDDEILYAVAVAAENKADWIPAYNGLQPATVTTDWYTEVSNAEEVQIVAGEGAYALADDVNDLRRRFLDLERMVLSGKIYTKVQTGAGAELTTAVGKNLAFVRNL